MLNQGLQSRRCGIKQPPVWAPPPPSRAPFTFVKEINLPLLSSGRGQSGRKRDACCRGVGGGGGGQSVLRGSLQPERTSRFLPCHWEETTRKGTPGTHTLHSTPDLYPDPATCVEISSLPVAEETQKNAFLGERSMYEHQGTNSQDSSNVIAVAKMSLYSNWEKQKNFFS